MKNYLNYIGWIIYLLALYLLVNIYGLGAFGIGALLGFGIVFINNFGRKR